MKIRIGLVLLALILSFTLIATATGFSDINSERWSWAKPGIEEMSGKGIIKGFPDGTFKPEQDVTKLQAIMLIARLWGIDDEDNIEYVKLAEEIHKANLLSYSISSKREVAYLLYKGILNKSELEQYIGSDNANKALKRYEAAILLTKALGKEAGVKNSVISILPYKDTTDIPQSARPYVKAVKDESIMEGMTETEFAPLVNVSRAQMAVMLNRVLKKNETEERVITGIVTDINLTKNTITVKNVIDVVNIYEIDEGILLRLDGRIAKLSDFKVNTRVRVTLRSDKLYMVEGLMPEVTEKVEGIVSSISTSGSTKKISVRVTENNTTVTKEYILDDEVDVYYEGKQSSLTSISVSDYAVLSVKKNRVIGLTAERKSKDIKGIIKDIILEPVVSLKLKLEDGDTATFEVMSDATVRRNNSTSDLRNILIGDEGDFTLEYNKVKRIVAKSTTKTDEGIIEEIVISAIPSIKIRSGNELFKYNISRNVEIKIDDKSTMNDRPIDIYNLRLNHSVKLTVESDVVVKVEARTLGQAQQMTGTVESVNKSYGFLRLTVIDVITREASIQQVFVKKGASIISSNSAKSRLLDLNSINAGDIVTIIGATDSGVFEASTIVIINN